MHKLQLYTFNLITILMQCSFSIISFNFCSYHLKYTEAGNFCCFWGNLGSKVARRCLPCFKPCPSASQTHAMINQPRQTSVFVSSLLIPLSAGLINTSSFLYRLWNSNLVMGIGREYCQEADGLILVLVMIEKAHNEATSFNPALDSKICGHNFLRAPRAKGY